MKKLTILLILATALAVSYPAFANCGHCEKDKQCAMQKNCERSRSDKECSQCPIAGKLMKKAHFYLENAQEIGLSDDQIAQIKAIKIDAKKAAIRQGADMEIFELDIKEKMSAPAVDVEGLNAMIDQVSADMASSAKTSVASYAKLKAVLSADQVKKAKEIWKKGEK